MRRPPRSTAPITPVVGAVLAVLLAAGCGGDRMVTSQDQDARYRDGRLAIATGNTTGVYYQLGGGYADLISRHLDGYQATAEATGASVENIQRVARGDCDIAFTLADAAADAAQGTGAFTTPQPIRALARIYTNYTQVIVRADAGIGAIIDMRGKRVSTGSPGSGTENIARRLIEAAGLDPVIDIHARALSLPETVASMKSGAIDALIWSGGLPTGGITDLIAAMGDGVVFLPLADLLTTLQQRYGDVYQMTTLSKAVYGTAADVLTIAVPNLLVVSAEMPDQLARDLAQVLLEHQDQLAEVHPEGRNISPERLRDTGAVPLHPGVIDYYGS